MYHTFASTSMGVGKEFKVSASLFTLPANFTFIAESLTITFKATSAPMFAQVELFNESGYLCKAFPPMIIPHTSGNIVRTYRWPKEVEHVNGATNATNIFGYIRVPYPDTGGTLWILIKLTARLGSPVKSIISLTHVDSAEHRAITPAAMSSSSSITDVSFLHTNTDTERVNARDAETQIDMDLIHD